MSGLFICLLVLLSPISGLFGSSSEETGHCSGADTGDSCGCIPPLEVTPCKEQDMYRSYSGSCNHLERPLWGSASTPFRRMQQPNYTDEKGTPRGWDPLEPLNGFPLPSARVVSNIRLRSPAVVDDQKLTSLVTFWGKILAMDVAFVPNTSKDDHSGKNCQSSCEFSDSCFPILIPTDDPTKKDKDCLPYRRATPVCPDLENKNGTTREQINIASSFVDGSMVYGSNDATGSALKDAATGKLRVGAPSTFNKDQNLLPVLGAIEGIDTQCMHREDPETPCFISGDKRINTNLGLVTLNTILVRLHNHLVQLISEVNPKWSGERLYQEARKIVGAVLQNIHYKQYLPLILGPEGMAMLGLYQGYNPEANPTVSAAFSVAASRFMDGTFQNHFLLLDDYYKEPEVHPLDKSFVNNALFIEKGIDSIIRGMVIQNAKIPDPLRVMNEALTEAYYKDVVEEGSFGQDLGAISIQRGRDFGLQPYIQYVHQCGLGEVRNWDDLAHLIQDPRVMHGLIDAYGTPENIDLFVGGLSENLVPEGRVGPIFRCIIVDTLKNVRDGDRFWFENDQFSAEQLEQVENLTLENIICSTADNIKSIPPSVFLDESWWRPLRNCSHIQQFNPQPWKDGSD